jgi:hypothetical protein
MFSISDAEFPDLKDFVEKVKSKFFENNEGREWCSDRGFLLHFSKTDTTSSSSESDGFYTLKYDRAKLTAEQYSTMGRFRSVVFDSNGHICCVAPPKMLTLSDEFKSHEVNSASSNLTAEELVEGIMVNLFWKYDNMCEDSQQYSGKWYMATKSWVGEVSFDHIIQAEAEARLAEAGETALESKDDGKEEASGAVDEPRGFQKLGVKEVLRRRICDVLSLLQGGLDSIPKNYCYSCVVQHPKNQIVNNITVPKLYLVAVYELSQSDASVGVNVVRIDRDIFSKNFGGSVSHMPSTLTCVSDETTTETTHTVEDYCKMYASADTRSVSLPGVVFVDKDTGFCYKKRNPKYESVKKRKGMEQKLAAQYLQLRKDRAIDEYLKYHPQHSRAFQQIRERLHEYTQKLYDAYIEHYVKKNAKPLKEYDRELKIHMYKVHYDVYLAKMKESGIFVTKHTIIDYVNQLAVAQQLACVIATPLPVRDGASKTSDSFQTQQKKQIVRSQHNSENSADAKSGFRNSRASRGGRSVPSLSVQIPPRTSSNENITNDEVSMKGSKVTGSVKVQNQFAGLDVDE